MYKTCTIDVKGVLYSSSLVLEHGSCASVRWLAFGVNPYLLSKRRSMFLLGNRKILKTCCNGDKFKSQLFAISAFEGQGHEYGNIYKYIETLDSYYDTDCLSIVDDAGKGS